MQTMNPLPLIIQRALTACPSIGDTILLRDIHKGNGSGTYTRAIELLRGTGHFSVEPDKRGKGRPPWLVTRITPTDISISPAPLTRPRARKNEPRASYEKTRG